MCRLMAAAASGNQRNLVLIDLLFLDDLESRKEFQLRMRKCDSGAHFLNDILRLVNDFFHFVKNSLLL